MLAPDVAGVVAPTLAMKSSISRCWVASSSEPLDDAVGGGAGEAGDLGAQLVADCGRRRRRCRRRPWPRARRPRRRAGPGRRRAAPRPGRRPRRAGAGARRRCRRAPGGCAAASASASVLACGRRRRARPGSVSVRSAIAFLSERAGLPEQQAEDDHRGEAAVDELGLLGPAASGGWCSPGRRCRARLLGSRCRPAMTVTWRRSSCDPRAHHVADRLGRPTSASGCCPVASSPARDGDVARPPSRRRPAAAARACSTSAAAAARCSAMRALTSASRSERSASSVGRAASMRCCASARTRPAGPRTRRPRPAAAAVTCVGLARGRRGSTA